MTVRRAFVVAWILLGIAGALNDTIALALSHRHLDLFLPHLKSGHVMFNRNLRVVRVYEYAGADGVRHDLADLVVTPALGYKRARVALDVFSHPDYLVEICYRATRSSVDPRTFFVEEFAVEPGARQPTRAFAFLCDPHGLHPL